MSINEIIELKQGTNINIDAFKGAQYNSCVNSLMNILKYSERETSMYNSQAANRICSECQMIEQS